MSEFFTYGLIVAGIGGGIIVYRFPSVWGFVGAFGFGFYVGFVEKVLF